MPRSTGINSTACPHQFVGRVNPRAQPREQRRLSRRHHASRLGPKSGPCYVAGVRIIAVSRLKAFVRRSPSYIDAYDPLMAWVRQVKAADWATPASVKREIGSASVLKDGRVVFNIAGNKYRLIVWINYPYRVVYIRFIGTHAQYDAIDAQRI